MVDVGRSVCTQSVTGVGRLKVLHQPGDIGWVGWRAVHPLDVPFRAALLGRMAYPPRRMSHFVRRCQGGIFHPTPAVSHATCQWALPKNVGPVLRRAKSTAGPSVLGTDPSHPLDKGTRWKRSSRSSQVARLGEAPPLLAAGRQINDASGGFRIGACAARR